MFHELSSETTFAAAFSLWAWLVARAAIAPSTGRFARSRARGRAARARAPRQRGASRLRRLSASSSRALAPAPPLGGRTRSSPPPSPSSRGRYTTAFASTRGRSRAAATQSFPSTAPSSPITSSRRRTASSHAGSPPRCNETCSRGSRTARTASRSTSYLHVGSFRVHEDLYLLSDQVFGWDDDYSILREAGVEGVRAHPGHLHARRARHRLGSAQQGLLSHGSVQHRSGVGRAGRVIINRRKRLPLPTEGEPIPAGQVVWISRPDQRIHQVWASPTKWHFEFDHPGDRARFEAIQREVDDLFDALPDRRGKRGARISAQPALTLVPKAMDVAPRSASSRCSPGVRRARYRRSSPCRSPRSRSSS